MAYKSVDMDVFRDRFAHDQPPLAGFHRRPHVHVADRDVRKQSRAARIFRFRDKRGPAIARAVDIDGEMAAAGVHILNGDAADRRGHAEHSERRVAVLGKDIANGHILDRSAADIKILQPRHGVVGVQSNEIVVGLSRRRGDILDQPVVHMAAEVEPILVVRRPHGGKPNIADGKTAQSCHADMIHGRGAHIESGQGQILHAAEIERSAGPGVRCEQIRGFIVVFSVVVAVPDPAGDGDIAVAGDSVGVCQEEITALFRLPLA